MLVTLQEEGTENLRNGSFNLSEDLLMLLLCTVYSRLGWRSAFREILPSLRPDSCRSAGVPGVCHQTQLLEDSRDQTRVDRLAQLVPLVAKNPISPALSKSLLLGCSV